MANVTTLSSGYQMLMMGLEVWRTEGKLIHNVILSAIKIGYHHLDCAADCHNEAKAGEALKEAFQITLIKREEIFITTKLWNSDNGHVLAACKDSMKKKLWVDYILISLSPTFLWLQGILELELLTMFWMKMDENGLLDIDTTTSLETTWHAMEDLVSMGLVRSIGISNNVIFLTWTVWLTQK